MLAAIYGGAYGGSCGRAYEGNFMEFVFGVWGDSFGCVVVGFFREIV